MAEAKVWHRFQLPTGEVYERHDGVEAILARYPAAVITHTVTMGAAGYAVLTRYVPEGEVAPEPDGNVPVRDERYGRHGATDDAGGEPPADAEPFAAETPPSDEPLSVDAADERPARRRGKG